MALAYVSQPFFCKSWWTLHTLGLGSTSSHLSTEDLLRLSSALATHQILAASSVAPQPELGSGAQIREKRQARFYEARMALAKQQARLADRKTVEEQVHLVKAPESLLKQQDAHREKLRIPVEQAAAQAERMAE